MYLVTFFILFKRIWFFNTMRRKVLLINISIREGNGNPLQYSCLENPRDGGAWWAAIYRVTQSRTQLKRLSISISNGMTKDFCKPCFYLYSQNVYLTVFTLEGLLIWVFLSLDIRSHSHLNKLDFLFILHSDSLRCMFHCHLNMHIK